MILNNVPTYYAFDPVGLTQVLIETTGGQSKKYVPGLAQFTGGAWAYQLPDGLGSVRQLTDPAGQISLIQNYDPFGSILQQVGAASPFGYTGEQTDPTGLVFLRARYYNPGIGIFLSKDPWPGHRLWSSSRNGWTYAAGNPVNLIDPSGLRPNCESPNCAVKLISTEIQELWPLLTSFRHLGIVFYNSNEDIYVIEGMPENGQLDTPGAIEDQTKPEVAMPGGMVERGENGAMFITVAEGEDVCNKWSCIKNKMQILEVLNIPYNSLGPNSNTAAFSVLKACNLPTSGPQYDTVDMWWHMGWGKDLSPFLQNDLYQNW